MSESSPPPFTWEDVDFLRYHQEKARREHGEYIAEGFDFEELADKIEARLPPREEE